MQDGAAAARRAPSAGGIANGAPAALIRCLARLIRCAIVASGTRNAAGDLGGGQAADGAQRERHLRRPASAPGGSTGTAAVSVSSWSRRASSSGAGATASGGSPSPRRPRGRRRALSLRNWSISRREATVISQPRGLSGHALGGPLRRGREQRLLDRVLARVELPVPAHEHAEDLRRQLAQQVLDASGRRSHLHPGRRPSPAAPPRRRPGRPASAAASSTARSRLSQSTTYWPAT